MEAAEIHVSEEFMWLQRFHIKIAFNRTCTKSLVFLEDKHLLDEVFGCWREVLREFVLGFNNLLEHVILICACKWAGSFDELVNNDSQAPDVCRLRGTKALENFWWHVVLGSNESIPFSFLAVVHVIALFSGGLTYAKGLGRFFWYVGSRQVSKF